MDITIETITPATASRMLQSNTANRPIDRSVLDRYANEIKSGRWDNDGSPIKFSKSGILLDGQHRLSAVCKAGMPIEAIVIRGLDDESFKTMDTGKKRNVSDILGVKGYKNTAAAASIASSYYYYVKTGHPANLGGAEKVTNAIALDVYEQNPEIAEAASFKENHIWIKKHLTSMAFGVLYVAACKIGERNIVQDFFKELCHPTARAFNSSIIPMRDRLIENKVSREKMSRTLMAAYVFKAYRDFRDGRNVRQLKVVLKDGKVTREHFKL